MKGDSLDIYISTYLAVYNCWKTSAMRLIFLLEMLQIKSIFKNWSKSWEHILSFLDNFIWIGCSKFSVLPGNSYSLGVNVLTNVLRFQILLRITFSNGKFPRVMNKGYKTTIVQIKAMFERPWLSYCVLKDNSLDIYISTYLALYNFGKT